MAVKQQLITSAGWSSGSDTKTIRSEWLSRKVVKGSRWLAGRILDLMGDLFFWA
jgi:hypothetical protein